MSGKAGINELLAILQKLDDPGENGMEKYSDNMRTLLAKVLKDQLSVEKTGDAQSTTTILQLVKNLRETWPGVFDHGEATGIGPYLFLLFPPLAAPSFSAIHDHLMETIEALLLLLLAKDVWAANALLSDFHRLFVVSFDLQGDGGPTDHQCFPSFSQDLMGDDEERRTCTVDLSRPRNRRLVHSKVTKLAIRMIASCPHFLSDRASQLWEDLCKQILRGLETFSANALELMSCLADHFQIPPCSAELVGATLLCALQSQLRPDSHGGALKHEDSPLDAMHDAASNAPAQHLANCIQRLCPSLPPQVVRNVSQDMLPLLLPTLRTRTCLALRQSLLVALGTSLRHTPAYLAYVLLLPSCFELSELQSSLVTCVRNSLDLARHSAQHAAMLAGGLDFEVDDLCEDMDVDHGRREFSSYLLRKRARASVAATEQAPKKRVVIKSDGASSGGRLVQRSAIEREKLPGELDAASVLALQIVESCAEPGETCDGGSSGNPPARALTRLQTLLLCLDASVDQAVWVMALDLLSSFVTQDAVKALRRCGHLSQLLETLKRAAKAIPPTLPSQALAKVLDNCLSTVHLKALHSTVHEQDALLVAGVMQTLSSASSRVVVDDASAAFTRSLQSSNQTLRVTAAMELPFFLCRSPDALLSASRCVEMLCRLVSSDGKDLAVSPYLATALAHMSCALCCAGNAGVGEHEVCDDALSNASLSAFWGRRFHVELQPFGSLPSEPRSLLCCLRRKGVCHAAGCRQDPACGPVTSKRANTAPVPAQQRSKVNVGEETQGKILRAGVWLLDEMVAKGDKVGLVKMLQALPVLLVHQRKEDLEKNRTVLKTCLDLAVAPATDQAVRGHAAFALGSIVHGDGFVLAGLVEAKRVPASASRHATSACLSVLLEDIRSVLRKCEPTDSNAGKMEGCVLSLAAIAACLQDCGSSIDSAVQNYEGVAVDLVMACVHSLAAGRAGLTSTAFQAVEYLASIQRVKVEELVFQEEVWGPVVTKLIQSLETDNLIPPFCQLFLLDHANEVDIFEDAGRRVLPQLVVEQNERLINVIADNLQLEGPGELLVNYLDSIVLHLFMITPESKSKAAFEQAAAFFDRVTGLDMYQCARDRKGEVYQVLLHIVLRISTAETDIAIKEGRGMLHRALELFASESGSQDVLKMFFPRFLNDQNTKNFRVSERSECTAGQIGLLRVLKFIIPELRRHLDEFFPMLMSTIRCAQQIVGLQEHACEVWHTLIQTAGPQSLQLRTSLTQVVVTLLFLAEKHPQGVHRSLRLLLIEWKEQLHREIRNIPYVKPLEEVPELDDVYQALQQEQHGLEKVENLLQRHLHGIGNDDEIVQMYALLELKGNLHLHRAHFSNIFVDHSRHASAVALMRDLIALLLTRCSHGRTDIRLAACECLGLIGAVDPSRIGLIQREREGMGNEGEDAIAIELIVKHLVKIVRSGADTGPTKASLAKRTLNTVERAQLAIQLLLQFLGCVDTSDESPMKKGRSHSTQGALSQHASHTARPRQPVFDERGRKNWQQIPEDVQQIVRPFLHTSFSFTEDVSEVAYPIYRRGLPFINWVKLFARDLVHKAEGKLGTVLKAVRPLLRLDTSLAQYVLRHALLHVLCLGEDGKSQQVRDELLLVLEDARVLDDQVDEGVVRDVVEPTVLVLTSSMQPAVELEGYTDLVLQIDGVRRGVVAIREGGRVSVAAPFPTSLSSKPLKYSICRVAPIMAVEDQRDGTGIKSVTQLVFSLVDDLTRWHEQQSVQLKQNKKTPTDIAIKIRNVSKFLAGIPKRVLAETSERCAAYDRALLYLETHVREEWWQRYRSAKEDMVLPPPPNERCDDKTVSLFQRIYVGLEDADGLKGIAKLRARSSLEEQILDSQISGDWTAALACYEQALQQEPGAVRYHLGLLRCLRNLGHLQTMLTHADGGIARYPREAQSFRKYGLEAAWRLGRWDMVKEYLGSAQQHNDFSGKVPFDYHLSHILISMKEVDQVQFKKQVRKARQSLFEPLAASSMESYQRAYPSLVKLHILAELEGMTPHVFGGDDASSVGREEWLHATLQFWEQRLSLTQQSLMGREPLLAVRRTLFQMLGMHQEVASSWVAFAKAARLAAQTGTAQSAIMQAERFDAAKAHLERAKLQLTSPAYQHDALRALREYIENHDRNDKRAKPEIYRKTLVMYWKQVQLFGSVPTPEVVKGFITDLSVFERRVDKETEQTFFTLGHFYDTLVFPDRAGRSRYGDGGGNGSRINDANDSENLKMIIKHYAESLKLGHKHIFQSLPRLLTLWFENSTNPKVDAATKTAANNVIQDMTRKVPSYVWLTVFPQLISRICHADHQVLVCLKNILAQVLSKHPREALWPLVSVLRSQQGIRSRPARDILRLPDHKDFPWPSSDDRKRFHTACAQLLGNDNSSATGKGLVAELMKLCNITVNKGTTVKSKTLQMRQDCRTLHRIGRDQYNHVLVPTQTMLYPTLPSDGKVDGQHLPFPEQSVTIAQFGEQIDVMNSLMSPVVIRIEGSDGAQYKFLCKPKDDLRKDSRMMDFASMINRLLLKDVDARRRNLYIRTFSVVPLNETTGMIQWVDNTTVLRSILNQLYTQEYGPERIRTSRLADMFGKEVKPRGKLEPIELYWKLRQQFPPIFHRWFLDNFAEPAAWVMARRTYVRTTAVWSMVGYVVGLGDRHSENILFDASNGDCVHVDFACLFNKGETLQIPERVPFRLTANMIDPMGVAGYEGAFTNVCAVVMRVLRENRESLMNVLETFAHDPLVEWIKKDHEGHRMLSKCERRLRGEVTRFPPARDICQVLSVDGQVRAVIAEAVSEANQCEMYKWWMPWY